MKIAIQIINETNGEQVFTATAPDINSAISELGRYDRIIEQGAKCVYCNEPCDEVNSLCSEECASQHDIELKEHNYKYDE